MPPTQASWRLAPGHHLYAVDATGDWRIAGPDDRFVKVSADPQELTWLRALLCGTPLPDAGSSSPLLEAFVEQGYAVSATGASDQLGPRRHQDLSTSHAMAEPAAAAAASVETVAADHHGEVLVVGDNAVAAVVADLLPGARLAADAVESEVASAAGVVACSDWLPDAAWQQLDRWCQEGGVPWTMCYADGLHWFVGPCSSPGHTPTYADTRARRLAAAGSPAEVAALWSYLDSPAPKAAATFPAGESAARAGPLVAGISAAILGDPPLSGSYQLELDPDTLIVTRHPVLALPDLYA